MGRNEAVETSRSNEAECSETTIEIKIKTLDSQTHTLRVNKQVPVPDLKEQIASVTGVLSEQQRLICRGKVLKDDQLLSAYNVEDGHTLHMVSRQPIPPSSEGLPSLPANDPASSTSRSQRIQVPPSFVFETLNIPDQGDGVLTDVNRIVAAVLGSFVNSTSSGNAGVAVHAHGLERHEGTVGAGGMTTLNLQQDQIGTGVPPDRSYGAFGLPTGVALGHLQPRVIPGSLTTLSQYLSRMRQEYNDGAAGIHWMEGRESNPQAGSGTVQEGLPTPSSLAEVLLSTREMLVEQTTECLLQLGTQLRNQTNVTDPVVRLSTQSDAWRNGILFQNLGAFLLELGRTTMTLRMGQTPAEAVVNAGPALFISRTGPNPLMVQPLPFHPGTNFGSIPSGTVQSGSGLVNDIGSRHIEIQIRRGTQMAGAGVNQEEREGSLGPSEQRNHAMSSGSETLVNQTTSGVSEGSSVTAETGVRLMPIRTTVASLPGSLRLPVLRRFQNVTSRRLNNRRGSQPFAEYHPQVAQTEPQPISESAGAQNIEDRARDGNSTNTASHQGSLPAPNSRSFNINFMSTSGSGNNQETQRELPSEVLQFLRTLFPGSEIHVEDADLETTTTGSVTENAGTASAAMHAEEEEPRASEEGIFLSNMLRDIIPFVSQLTGSEPNVELTEAVNVSENIAAQDAPTEAENSDIGTSRRQSDGQPDPPNPKRQKME